MVVDFMYQLISEVSFLYSTGKTICEAVDDIVKDCGIKDKVFAMTYDTTAANTGRHRGKKINLKLLSYHVKIYLC